MCCEVRWLGVAYVRGVLGSLWGEADFQALKNVSRALSEIKLLDTPECFRDKVTTGCVRI
jgi:hypothetical protein